MNLYVCWDEETEIISSMEVANEMNSAIKVATQEKTVMEVANEMKL